MKKIIKNICKRKTIFMLLLILISLFFGIKGVNADKKYCSEIKNPDYCPVNGKDSYGNACVLGYNGNEYGCKKNESAKTCKDFQKEGKCPPNDDYGNVCKYYTDPSTCYIHEESQNTEFKTCDQYTDYKTCPVGKTDYLGNVCQSDSSGACYTSNNNAGCSEIKNAGICNGKTNECIWAKNNNNNEYSCHNVGDNDYITETCPEIKDGTACDARTDCNWVVVDYLKGHECIELTTPTPDSPSCSEIQDKKTCESRVDCTPDGNNCKELSNYNLGNGSASSGIINKTVAFKCSDVKYLTSAWLFIRIAAPFIVILFGSLDFFKSMIANDEKKMRESRGKFVKRLIAFLLLILLPFIVQFIFSVMGTYGSENVCLVKCIVTNNTTEKGCE